MQKLNNYLAYIICSICKSWGQSWDMSKSRSQVGTGFSHTKSSSNQPTTDAQVPRSSMSYYMFTMFNMFARRWQFIWLRHSGKHFPFWTDFQIWILFQAILHPDSPLYSWLQPGNKSLLCFWRILRRPACASISCRFRMVLMQKMWWWRCRNIHVDGIQTRAKQILLGVLSIRLQSPLRFRKYVVRIPVHEKMTQVEILSSRLHSSINLVGLALGNPLLSPKIQFSFSEMSQVMALCPSRPSKDQTVTVFIIH